MPQTYLTRTDADVGVGLFDSIAWALEEHVHIADYSMYNFAVLHGNEDSPDKLEFWVSEPNFDTPPDYVWVRG
jgi:hypothetical protein